MIVYLQVSTYLGTYLRLPFRSRSTYWNYWMINEQTLIPNKNPIFYKIFLKRHNY